MLAQEDELLRTHRNAISGFMELMANQIDLVEETEGGSPFADYLGELQGVMMIAERLVGTVKLEAGRMRERLREEHHEQWLI